MFRKLTIIATYQHHYFFLKQTARTTQKSIKTEQKKIKINL